MFGKHDNNGHNKLFKRVWSQVKSIQQCYDTCDETKTRKGIIYMRRKKMRHNIIASLLIFHIFIFLVLQCSNSQMERVKLVRFLQFYVRFNVPF